MSSKKETEEKMPMGTDDQQDGIPDDDGDPMGNTDGFDDAMGAMMTGGGDDGVDFLASLDMSKIKDSSFVTLIHGEEYDFLIKKAIGGKSANGNRTIKLILEVGEEYPEAGGVIMDTITLTEASMWRYKSLIKSAELMSDEGLYIGTGYASLVGCNVRAKIKNEPWNGEMRSKVDGAYKAPQSVTGIGDGGVPSFE